MGFRKQGRVLPQQASIPTHPCDPSHLRTAYTLWPWKVPANTGPSAVPSSQAWRRWWEGNRSLCSHTKELHYLIIMANHILCARCLLHGAGHVCCCQIHCGSACCICISCRSHFQCLCPVLCVYDAVSFSGVIYMCAEPRGGHKASLVNFQTQGKLRCLFSIPK